MTPKFKDGKPLFQAGKPSFCCCPSGCCPYPGLAYGTDLLFSDLPVNIFIRYDSGSDPGPMLAKYEDLVAGKDGYFKGDNPSGPWFDGEWMYILEPGGNWEFYIYAGDEWLFIAGFECLINDAIGSSDPFPDTLYASWHGDTATLNRVSDCRWEGVSDTEGAAVALFWGTETNKWTISITWDSAVEGYPNTPGTGGSNLEPIALGGAGQSTPVGNYTNLGGWDYRPPETSGGVTITE